MAFDTPASPQYERDLRSAHKDFKRNKDSVSKWANGSRQARTPDLDFPEAKFRPTRPPPCPSYMHKQHNIVKANRGNCWMPPGRVRNFSDALLEIDDAKHLSFADMGGSLHARQSDSDNSIGTSPAVLYSFDNTDSPPPVLTLDVFVKPNVRATEKLVEKEYEVLDDNGDAVKGRKARQMLRKRSVAAKSKAPLAEALDEDDFELI